MFWFNDLLTAGFGPTCLPEPQFRFDMVSPDISARPGWAQSQGVAFAAGWNVPEILMQPILGRADGLDSIAPIDDNGERIFYPMTAPTGTKQQFHIPITINEGTINNFRLKYFGAPCPLLPRDSFESHMLVRYPAGLGDI